MRVGCGVRGACGVWMWGRPKMSRLVVVIAIYQKSWRQNLFMCQICKVAMRLHKNNRGNSPLSDTRKFSLLMQKPVLVETSNSNETGVRSNK